MRHIVALSGGKDSTALALRLAEVEPRDYEFICTPTGYELTEMFTHWERLGRLLGKPIIPVTSGHSLARLVQIQRAIPNNQMRWCTRMTKIEPAKHYYFNAAPCVAYVGLRADEPEDVRIGLYGEMEGVRQRYPLREWGWGLREVWGYLDSRGVVIPKRTDCDRCFYQRLDEWWDLWYSHRDNFEDAARQEEEIGHTWRGPSRDTWPTALKDLAAEFEKGRRPVRRAKAGSHGKQIAGQTNFLEERGEMCRACSL